MRIAIYNIKVIKYVIQELVIFSFIYLIALCFSTCYELQTTSVLTNFFCFRHDVKITPVELSTGVTSAFNGLDQNL